MNPVRNSPPQRPYGRARPVRGQTMRGQFVARKASNVARAGAISNGMNKSDLWPMLATLIDKPFDNSDWVFEMKWDGFRIVANIERGNVTLYSRNGKDVTARYPTVAKSLSKISTNCAIDGELTALDEKGRSRFQLLQNALREKTGLRYYVFDLLFLRGKDLRHAPLLERKKLLKKILPRGKIVQYSEHVQKKGIAYFEKAKKRGEEGIIAKRAAGFYYSGERTREWLKIKVGHEQEVVIVGFTKPRRSRKYFGSLVLAVRERDKWHYVGHVGTGFNFLLLKTLYQKMLPLKISKKPIEEKIPDESETMWIKPKLVGEVKFTEWTSGGEMRHPAFKGLRDDKAAINVIRELPNKL